MLKKNWQKILCFFIVWRLILFLIAALAPQILAYQPSFPNAVGLSHFNLPKWLYSWGNFDGVHYLTIARKGYLGTGLIQAFFPLYPLLVRFLNIIFQNRLLTAIVLSNLMSIAMLLSFYLLIKDDLKKTWSIAILLLMIFPSSFFFGASYSESLFLTLIFLSFYFFKKEKLFWVVILTSLASATRVVGIFLVPAFIIAQFFKKKNKIKLKKVLLICLGSLGLLIYMFYLWRVFGDPLYFFHLQSKFGASRQTNLVLLPQVIWRYIKILMTVRPINLKYYAYSQEFVLSIWALVVLIKASFSKRIPLEQLIFAFLAYLLPPLTGNFSSMPRYILVCFPIFIYLAQNWSQKKAWKKIFYLTISSILLIINCILFIQGYWVA